jgi:hypothetical protein
MLTDMAEVLPFGSSKKAAQLKILTLLWLTTNAKAHRISEK